MVDPESDKESQLKLASELVKLSKNYEDKVDFTVMDYSDQNLRFAYECYHAPCSYYIDAHDARSFYMLGMEVDANKTATWIDDHTYKKSCSKFKAPARLPDWKLHWGKAKWSIREKYD